MTHLFVFAEMHIKKIQKDSLAVLLDVIVPWQDVIEVLRKPLDVGVWQVLEEIREVLQ